ncbi:MAG: Selenide, water dikinase [Pelotomaculum sp. PtaB.Bin117]|nr:MAG: Selenide, water dikinase [Pelotomaculum sp. PtaB.Bin117]OPY63996.1 MAG: Selenide, water dikinase [Pelotomaculum sp. PtaU1.Bin065]
MLRQLEQVEDPNLLVGSSTSDDAAVYRLNNDMAIVQTVDYFTPVVDDPYTFGLITAANALSDIYAMGAKPLLALNIIGFPTKTLPLEVMVQILKGGAEKVKEAGAIPAGGHTIEDEELKYGLSVTGVVHPERIVTNAGARPGDTLILTKPLGIGIVTTALRGDLVDKATYQGAVELMVTLNNRAARVMIETGINACTDVTGFGLLGHLYEMLAASGVGARLRLPAIPVLRQARSLAGMGIIPAGAYRNLNYLDDFLTWEGGIEDVDRLVLADPQTSGGLLMAVPGDKTEIVMDGLLAEGVAAAEIGEVIDAKPRILVINS